MITFHATVTHPDGTTTTDRASGNTPRTAAAARAAMERDLREEYPTATITIRKERQS